MAELRLLALGEALSADQIAELKRKLIEYGVQQLHDSEDAVDLEDPISEEQLTDFLDRLEAHDIAADIYLPVEFDGRVTVGDHTFGSVQILTEALEEIREELDIDDEVSEDDEDVDLEMIDAHLIPAWRVFSRAATASLDRQVPIHVLP